MNVEQALQMRNLAGRTAAVLLLLLFVAVVDGFISIFSQPPDVVRATPGSVQKINGPLTHEVQGTEDLTYTGSSDLMEVTFEQIHKGFWMGGLMWRGILELSPHIPPGEHFLTVAVRGAEENGRFNRYRVMVYENRAALRKSSKSRVERHLNLSPWLLSASILPVAIAGFGVVFLLSQKLERLLEQEGKALVYMVRKEKGATHYEVAFGLGTKHGVNAGDHLRVLNKAGQEVGEVHVTQAFDRDSLASAGTDLVIAPGCIVRKPR